MFVLMTNENLNGKSCDPNRWNGQAGRALGTKEDTRVLNAYLDQLQSKAQELHQVITIANETVTAETVKNRFIGKAFQSRTIVAIFEDHNAKMKRLIGKEFEKSTLQRYETCLMHVKDFMQLTYNCNDIPVIKITFAFLVDFEYYLRSVRNCGNNSAIKYIKNLGKIVRICLGNGWLAVDPYLNYKPKQNTVNREVLTKEELNRIKEKQFSMERGSVSCI